VLVCSLVLSFKVNLTKLIEESGVYIVFHLPGHLPGVATPV